METTTSLMDKAIQELRNAATELDEFKNQLSYEGVAEKYELVKKKFHQSITDAKNNLKHDKDVSALTEKFNELLKHLELGEALTKEAFLVQKEKIQKSIEEIEAALTDTESIFDIQLNTEIEKFKIKMEIIRLQLELGKLGTKKELTAIGDEFKVKVDQIKNTFMEEETLIKKHWHQFRSEIKDAYTHLKKEIVA